MNFTTFQLSTVSQNASFAATIVTYQVVVGCLWKFMHIPMTYIREAKLFDFAKFWKVVVVSPLVFLKLILVVW